MRATSLAVRCSMPSRLGARSCGPRQYSYFTPSLTFQISLSRAPTYYRERRKRKSGLHREIWPAMATSCAKSSPKRSEPPSGRESHSTLRMPPTPMEISHRKISPPCREKIIAPPLVLWSTLRSHQMPNAMVGFRLCASWWQTNGEDVYDIHEPASSSASCALRAHVHRASTVLS